MTNRIFSQICICKGYPDNYCRVFYTTITEIIIFQENNHGNSKIFLDSRAGKCWKKNRANKNIFVEILAVYIVGRTVANFIGLYFQVLHLFYMHLRAMCLMLCQNFTIGSLDWLPHIFNHDRIVYFHTRLCVLHKIYIN